MQKLFKKSSNLFGSLNSIARNVSYRNETYFYVK